jgi:hypothetical protein
MRQDRSQDVEIRLVLQVRRPLVRIALNNSTLAGPVRVDRGHHLSIQ